MPEFVVLGKLDVDDATAAVLNLGQQLRQTMVALWPNDEIDDRRPAQQLLALGLGDATRHGDNRR